MEISRGSLAVAVTLSLLVLSSGCAVQHGPAAIIQPGTNVVHPNAINTNPAAPSAVPAGAKHFAGAQ
jgi:hypothetical protein